MLACEPGAGGSTAPEDAGGPAPVAATGSAEGQALLDAYLEETLERSPVSATGMGDHRYDARWPDLSAEGLEATRNWRADLLTRVEAALENCGDPDVCLDLESVRDVLRSSQLSDEVQKPWTTNPMAYAGTMSGGLDDLITRDFAPIDERAANLAARLETLPVVATQALANLQPSSELKAPHTQVAIAQLGGLRNLIEKEIPERMKDASPESRERLAAATPKAVAAVEELKSSLEKQLPEAKGEWRLGKDAFSKKLPLTLQTRHSADQVHELALAAHAEVRGEMAALARELHPVLLGPKALTKIEKKASSPDAADQRIIKDVLRELSEDRVAANDLRDAAEENLDRLEAFVRAEKIVPMDEAEVLQVIWTPEHARGYAIAGLAAPGPLEEVEAGLPSFYLVQPVPSEWDADRRESFLREYNRFMLEILSIHEAIPGHFVQLYHGKRDDSKVRRVLANGPFVEGWAVYTEWVMVGHGYPGKGPAAGAKRPKGTSKGLWAVQQDSELRAKAIALHRLKFYLRTVTNAIIDYEIHSGDMGEEQAVEFMVDRSFQGEGEARGKWVRAQLSSTQLSTYFVGATAWFELRQQAEARAKERGEAFDLSAFHGEALSHGAPPVHRLPELMGW
jgi:uncharacterized protein (DUF885 family)